MPSRARAAVTPSVIFGGLMAAGAFWRASAQQSSPLTGLAATVETFLMFGLLAFGLQVLGLAWRDPDSGQLHISSWLAWAVAGGLVTFLTVLIVVNRRSTELRLVPAIVAAGVWIAAVSVTSVLRRSSRRSAA